MIAWFTKNHVAANLLLVTIVLAGLFSLSTQIPLEIFPDIQADSVSVNVSLRGATPEDVEQGISIRIEESVQDLEGIEKITSISSEGSARVILEIDDGYDPRELLADIKSRVDSINTFPADADKPIIALAERKRETIAVAIASDYGEKQTREYGEYIRDQLLRLPNVTQVELTGIRNYEIAIEINQDTLRQYQLTLDQISSSISAYSVDVSAGSLKTQGGDVLIRAKSQAYYKQDFERIIVKQKSDGTLIRLGDIATINDGFEETPVTVRFNGKQAVLIDVYRIGPQSAIEVADEVKEFIDNQQEKLPQGFELNYWDDDSLIVKSRIATLTTNAIQGGILVLILLTLFLRPAIAFWVFIGIPVSFMGAFIVMPFFGVSINIMSLFGFIVVLGIVVDDAIVTGENVYRHMKTAESSEQAAILGTQEVATPVTFGVLTTVAAFLPLAFIEGMRGALFAQISVVVIPVLLFSLIESKFVLPAHLKNIKMRSKDAKTSKLEKLQQSFADGFEQAVLKYYQPLLGVVLRYKLATVSLFLGVLLIISALISSGWVNFVFFPRIPGETVRATLVMPAGTPFEVTHKHIENMSDKARELQEKYRDEDTGESVILNVLASTGTRGGAGNNGQVRFEIMPAAERTIDIDSRGLVSEWRKLITAIPGAESLTFRAEIGRSSDPIDVQLTGNSLATLTEVSEQVKQHLTGYPTVFEIADNISDGKEELQIQLNEQGLALGLNVVDISRQVRNAYFGSQAQRIQRGRDDIRVMVRLPINERESVAGLKDIMIRTPQGGDVPLDHIAVLSPSNSPSEIYRIDRYRSVNITADIDKENTNMTVLQADLNTYLSELMQQYPTVGYTLAGEAKEQRESFTSLAWGLLFVFFVIYALLAIPFKSYLQPIIVMSVIPFGMIGAVIGHWLMGMDLTIMSLLGMLALTGILVNDSLVLVDFINKERAKGGDLFEVVQQAAAARFRPVMLTSLTTFIGLMPLLFEKAIQAQFLIPMAVSLGFGILFATMITLLLVPVNYLLMEKFQNIFNKEKLTQ
jgi:multidrug efflux pump subunit AcrB